MAKALFLVAKAERELPTGLPKVKVVVGNKDEDKGDNDAKVAALTGLTVVAGQKLVSAAAGAGGKALWNTGRERAGVYLAARKARRP